MWSLPAWSVPGEPVLITGRKIYFRGNQIKVAISMARPNGGSLLRHPGGEGVPRAEFDEKHELHSEPIVRANHGGDETMKRRVVITGMGVVAPNASLTAFEQALQAGISGDRHIPELANELACQVGSASGF